MTCLLQLVFEKELFSQKGKQGTEIITGAVTSDKKPSLLGMPSVTSLSPESSHRFPFSVNTPPNWHMNTVPPNTAFVFLFPRKVEKCCSNQSYLPSAEDQTSAEHCHRPVT